MNDLAGLIAKLEAASEGSRELDIAIAYACLPEHHSGRWGVVTAPNFTTSIDAALTLVPEGCGWEVAKTIAYEHRAIIHGHDLHEDSWGASSPALALCIAALKARAA